LVGGLFQVQPIMAPLAFILLLLMRLTVIALDRKIYKQKYLETEFEKKEKKENQMDCKFAKITTKCNLEEQCKRGEMFDLIYTQNIYEAAEKTTKSFERFNQLKEESWENPSK